MNISELKTKLVLGDVSTVAEILGVSKSYVRNIIDGHRDINSKKAKKIVEILNRLIEKRDELRYEIATETTHENV